MVAENLAQQVEVQQPLQQPEQSPKKVLKPGQHAKPSRFSRAEKFFAVVFIVTMAVFMMKLVTVQNGISTASKKMQDIDNQVTDIKNQNDNYKQEISELSRYDRVYDIADKYGLKMIENNIRNVKK